MTVYEELNERGLIKQMTDEKIKDALSTKQTIYVGIDPTGDTLHVGHLMPIILMKHFENYGHRVIALMGGATGLIGDPSFKKAERQLLSSEVVEENVRKIASQVSRFFKEDLIIENNLNWGKNISMIEFLRDYGKHFNLNTMLSKESVSSRLESGISYTEFSYQILQALDFKTLFENYECSIQAGGSDQWGNIVAGTELIRKTIPEAEVYGLTVPLVTKSDGTKFGKSESGAIWLDPKQTSVYDFYQFFFNSEDKDVIRYLKTFTFLPIEEINELEKSLAEEPFKRLAPKKLAEEITKFVHGEEGLKTAQKVTTCLFSGDLSNLTVDEIENNLQGLDKIIIKENTTILEGLIEGKLAASKREGREFLQNNSIKLNGETINNEEKLLTKSEAIGNKYYLIKRGKKKFSFIEVTNV